MDPEYIRGMRRLGYTLTLEQLITARDHGVTPDYIESMVSLGYRGLTIDTLIRLRDHGVTPDYVVEMQRRGLKDLPADEIIRLRDRGETGYLRKLGQLNYHFQRLLEWLL